MSLAFVLLDFQHVGVRRRAQCTRRSVELSQQRASFAGLSMARVLTFYGPRSEFCLSEAGILTFYGLNSDFLRSEFCLSTV